MTNQIPQIKTNRILLREIVDSDLENIFNGLSNPQVVKHYGVSFQSLEATKEQMAWFSQSQQNWWAICSSDNQKFYGAAGLNDISLEHKKAEIGMWLLPTYWGQGIMSEVIPLICNYAFKNLGLHRIEGFVDSGNNNCKRAMSKLQFNYEGTMRDCEIKNGAFVSVDIYAMINGGK